MPAMSTGIPRVVSDVVELTFGAQDVRILESETAYDGHFQLRKLTLQHRCFGGGWSRAAGA